jgi:anti-sigma regulatory factor (Ser/Thr protein kinase)
MTGSPWDVEAFFAEADVAGGPKAAARARRLVEHELAGRMPADQVADVCLLVTELVANGVRHGGATIDTSFLRVLLEGSEPGLRVEVVNAGRGRGAVAQRRPEMDGGGGIGLHLVERLSARWGVRDGARTSVWFELDC